MLLVLLDMIPFDTATLKQKIIQQKSTCQELHFLCTEATGGSPNISMKITCLRIQLVMRLLSVIIRIRKSIMSEGFWKII